MKFEIANQKIKKKKIEPTQPGFGSLLTSPDLISLLTLPCLFFQLIFAAINCCTFPVCDLQQYHKHVLKLPPRF